MRKSVQRLGQLLLFLLFSTAGFSQYTVKGKITDEARNEPLPNVSVQIKGTKIGTVTGTDGTFSLAVPDNKSVTLVISLVGFMSQSINVSSTSAALDVSLKTDVLNLEEVVVTGLATSVKRSNLANAVTSINSKELTGTTQIQTTDGALYSKVPGANIRMNGGAPGGGLSIQLRGVSSLVGASQPLIILDGVYINNSFQRTGRATITGAAAGAGAPAQDDGANRLADINPADIQNIEVLKGPSAAAIYGTRANAGVIIITTKKGSTGKTAISFGQDIGFGRPLRLVGTDDWSVEKINFFFTNATKRATELARFQQAQSTGQFFDYEEIFYANTATLSNTRLTVTGGTDKTKFYVGGVITNEEGTVRRTGFERYSIRANIEHKISNRLNFSVNSNYVRSNTDRGFTGNQNNTGASIGYNISYIPNYFDLRPNAAGIYPDVDYGGPRENPLAVTDKATNNSLVNRFIQSGTLNWEIIDRANSGLKLQVTGGIDFVQNKTLIHLPEDLQYQRSQANPGDVLHGRQESFNKNFQAALVHNVNVNKFGFTTQAGIVRLEFDYNSFFIRGRGLAPKQTNVQQATVQQIDQQFDSRVQEAGIFAQEEVNWDDKIIATAGVRFDKSTLNGDINKMYAFPKASLAINLTNFDFWNVGFINQLKPRIAYGETAGPVAFGSTFTPLNGTNIGGLLGSVVSTQIGNTGIRPETAREIEFGIDAGLFKNRLSLEATYYIKTTANNIQNLNLSPAVGVNTTPSNEAELENKGIELALAGTVIQKSNVRWFSRLMWWKNDVLVKKLGIPSYLTGAFGTGLGTFLIQEGVSPLTIVGSPAITPGVFTVWGNNQPKFTMSWFNTVTFLKNFDFSMMWEWRNGGDNINLTSFLTDSGGTTEGWFDDDNKDGTPNGRQRPPAPYNNAGRWVQDATFLKMREIGLYYNVPQNSVNKWFNGFVDRIRIGASGNNVLLFTKYEGYDPETSTFGAQSIAGNVDVAPYPTTRRLFFHINLDF
ncbi:SusC/RagA family TonB-linked outer membrane protein [Lacibacter sp. H375]|uniref:SusC/RagA family TonB-linked outer membrane protein n=1 Tax=Lacibacter sp. H375 TaxID=3133424 RepID=UPI0030C103BA